MNYTIDNSGWSDGGGYCQVYPIKDKEGWVFKEFRNKKKAQESLSLQQKLVRYDLAPQIYSKLCRLNFMSEDGYNPEESSDWGYIIEKAYPVHHNDKTMKDIQYLVEDIQDKTGLEFWDCHWYNVGMIKRNGKNKVVCIDTGKESFNGISNAWGMASAGPKCCYCNNYQCKCSED